MHHSKGNISKDMPVVHEVKFSSKGTILKGKNSLQLGRRCFHFSVALVRI